MWVLGLSSKTLKGLRRHTLGKATPTDWKYIMGSEAELEGSLPYKSRLSLLELQMQVEWIKISDFRQISRYNLKTVQDRRKVLLKSNKKSYTLYRMVRLPTTLDHH